MSSAISTRPQAVTALRAMASSLSMAVDLDSTLDLIAEKTTEVMHVDSCTIYLLDEDAKTLRLRATTGLRKQVLGIATLGYGEGMTGAALAENRPIYARYARNHPNFKLIDAIREESFQSLLAIPLCLENRPIGALNVQTTRQHNFSQDEIDVLLLIGELAAGALTKAQLYDQQTAQLAEMRQLAAENARLTNSKAILREMHHRIKNNLQMVTMLMQLQLPEAHHTETKDALKSNIHRIRSIATVHEVLSEKGFRLVDVKDVLTRLASATMQAVTTENRPITITVLGDTITLPSQAATAIALSVNELVTNAVEHAFVGRNSGKIEITFGKSAEEIIVRVCDNGIGIGDTQRRGLGLEIVDTLITEDLSGSLQFKVGDGTEVTIRIPREN